MPRVVKVEPLQAESLPHSVIRVGRIFPSHLASSTAPPFPAATGSAGAHRYQPLRLRTSSHEPGIHRNNWPRCLWRRCGCLWWCSICPARRCSGSSKKPPPVRLIANGRCGFSFRLEPCWTRHTRSCTLRCAMQHFIPMNRSYTEADILTTARMAAGMTSRARRVRPTIHAG